jgi:hypothetical protein
MPELPGLVPIAFTIFSYVVCVKLAAWLYRRTQLSWKHAFIFGVVLFMVLFAVGAVVRSLGAGSDPIRQSLVDLATGLAAQLGLGAWWLGSRARTRADAPLELKGGALLALMTYGLVFFFSLAAAIALPFFASMAGNAV